jgi:hypothetical protein
VAGSAGAIWTGGATQPIDNDRRQRATARSPPVAMPLCHAAQCSKTSQATASFPSITHRPAQIRFGSRFAPRPDLNGCCDYFITNPSPVDCAPISPLLILQWITESENKPQQILKFTRFMAILRQILPEFRPNFMDRLRASIGY